ncbi:hypothetical protein C8R45DRAFT_943059 [Mycena sanguinolenta]|nr:hypothetical protein C8R45DRAFT_943059 [Mycena sanguinolenta]
MALLVVLFHALRVASQVASPSWNSTLIASSAERVTLAGTALDVAIDRLSPDGLFDDSDGQAAFGLAGYLYSQMADFDIATNQTKYQTILENKFQLVEPLRTNFSDPYVRCAVQSSLNFIADESRHHKLTDKLWTSWWFGSGRTISASDIAARKIAGKNFTITATCEDVTMVGGTYWNDDPAEPSIAAVGTGYFLVLSALLAEAMPDPMYLQAANQSADFIRSHLYKPLDIVQEFFTGTGCEVTGSLNPTNSGLMIEGLSILHSLTNDISTQNLLSDLIVAVIPNTEWQGANGIVNNGGMGDMNLLQGLGTVYARNSVNATLRQYVGDYITVQFNAVTNLATSAGTNIYGRSWTGPPSDIFWGYNQTVALGALISAIGLETAASSSTTLAPTSLMSSTTPAPSTSSSATPQSRVRHVGAILGSTFGALAFVVILATAWFIRRRRSRTIITNSTPSVSEVSPFVTESSVMTFSGSRFGQGEKRSKHRVPPAPFGQREKRSEHREPPAPSTLDTAQSSHSPNVNPQPNIVETNRDTVSVLPTERLVQILNQRLQDRTWEEGEAPPAYPVV